MLKKTITYTDYNGTERTEDFYFNLSKAEAMEMEMGTSGGLTETIKKIVAAQDSPSIIKIFKYFILKAYGEKSLDGKRFIKSKEISEAFSQTEAYNVLYMELLSDAKKAAEFINAILPEKFRGDAKGETADAVLTPVGEDSPSLNPAT